MATRHAAPPPPAASSPAGPGASARTSSTANALAALLDAEPGRTLAWRDGAPVTAAAFLRDARAIARAAGWPGGVRVVNVCEDRYAFLAAFAAALLRGGATLLPPSRAPAVVAEVAASEPGTRLCDDATVAAALGAGGAGGAALQAGAAPRDDALGEYAAIGYTSGSTGVPKRYPKRWSEFLETDARNAARIRAELAALGFGAAAPTVVATVPSQHMYGIETTVLLPLASGFAVHAARPLFPADVAATLAEVPAPRVLVTTPVHLRVLVEAVEAGTERLPPIAVIVCATAPLERELAARAEAALDARLVEMFGATETCIIAARRTALEMAWTPYAGVTLEPDPAGTWIRAPWLPAPVQMQDTLESVADGRFEIRGRSTDLVEVAGKRASLAELTRRLRAVPGVVDAVVFQPEVADRRGVRRVAALAVAPTLDPGAILAALAEAVDPAFLPRPLVLVEALPRNEVGKLPRERLLAALGRS